MRRPRIVSVEAVEPLSPGMLRITFGGDDLDGFSAGTFTDHYVKLHFAPPGADYAPPFDPAQVRASAPREQWPRTRTYTVRRWDPARRLLTIDFVVHGDDGVAGPWATNARIGDAVQLMGPGGAYAPDPAADRHILVGDESAHPAIAAALERIPAGRPADVVLQVRDAEHELPLSSSTALRVRWLHGGDEGPVLHAVQRLPIAAGEKVHAFVHGEAAMVRAVRRHLIVDRRLPPEMLSASGYWKRDRTEEGWREDKPEWNRLAEADVGPPTTGGWR